jgi:hypothetical protein
MEKRKREKLEKRVETQEPSESPKFKDPEIQRAVSLAVIEVCSFYAYFDALKYQNPTNPEKEKMYTLMKNIRDKYGSPTLYNKLDEIEDYLKNGRG